MRSIIWHTIGRVVGIVRIVKARRQQDPGVSGDPIALSEPISVCISTGRRPVVEVLSMDAEVLR
jgi:hypothetical protein